MTPSHELADRVHTVAMRLLRAVREADARSELSTARFSALSTLVYDGPSSVGELAASEHVTAPTMSRLVTALERAGYVTRESDSADGRRVQVAPTQAGVEALAAARRERVERLATVFEGMGEENQAAVLAATEVLDEVLDPPGR
jgi:DNA-binding MarR family transcriptional regulator